MFQHFLRYVGEENLFLFLKHARRCRNTRNFGTDFDRGGVRFSVELKEMQTLFLTAQDIEVGTMEATTAGQNAAQTVQDGFYRRLLDHRAGHVEQGSVPAIARRYRGTAFSRHALIFLWFIVLTVLQLQRHGSSGNCVLLSMRSKHSPGAPQARRRKEPR